MFSTRRFGILIVAATLSVFLGTSQPSKAGDGYCTDSSSCAFLESYCASQNPASYEWDCFQYDVNGQCTYGACRFLGTSPTPAPDGQ
jgi:hypothetical protein